MKTVKEVIFKNTKYFDVFCAMLDVPKNAATVIVVFVEQNGDAKITAIDEVDQEIVIDFPSDNIDKLHVDKLSSEDMDAGYIEAFAQKRE